MSSVRTVVLNALDKIIGVKTNPIYAKNLVAGNDTLLSDLNMDSLSRMESIMVIEEALGVEIDDDEVMEQHTLDGLISYLEGRVGPAKDG
jgi:acyl carrier protein